jgi:hypothetical protein
MTENFDELHINPSIADEDATPIPVGDGEVVFSFVGDLGGLVMSLPEEGVSVALNVPPSLGQWSDGEITKRLGEIETIEFLERPEDIIEVLPDGDINIQTFPPDLRPELRAERLALEAEIYRRALKAHNG